MKGAEGFAAIPNWMFRGRKVSKNAILVYGALASHSGYGGIFPSQETLAEEAQVSERTVREALAELEAKGLIERARRRGRAGRSTSLSTGYSLRPNGPTELPAVVAGSSKGPAISDEATGRIEQVVPLIEEEPIKNPEQAFDEFWKIYPRRVSKLAAHKAFLAAAKKSDVDLILDGARRLANDPNLPDKQFIKHPTTWLNGGGWEDEPLPTRFDRPQVVDVGRDEWMLA